jgi:hypothetical protein
MMVPSFGLMPKAAVPSGEKLCHNWMRMNSSSQILMSSISHRLAETHSYSLLSLAEEILFQLMFGSPVGHLQSHYRALCQKESLPPIL